MLEIKKLSFSYADQKIFENISCKFEAGKIYAIVGLSGAGKSTFIRSISGAQKCSGEIYYCGDNLSELKQSERPIVTMHQGESLFPHMTVKENILFGIRSYFNKDKFKIIDQDKYLLELLCEVELQGYENKFPNELSGGEKQRVSLARALAIRPKVILLDEPFSALDQSLRSKLNDLLYSVVKKSNITCLKITHNNEDALNWSDYIALLDNNTITMSDIDSIKYRPSDTKIMKYFKNGIKVEGELVSINSLTEDSTHRKIEFKVKERSRIGNVSKYLLEYEAQEVFFYSKREDLSSLELFF